MLLYWLLATYVLTRSPRSPISLTAVAAQVAAACYLLGQGMALNAETFEQWLPWARNLQWGAIIAPTLWYWLTLLLLQEQDDSGIRRYATRLGMPLGILFAAGSLTLTVALYADDL